MNITYEGTGYFKIPKNTTLPVPSNNKNIKSIVANTDGNKVTFQFVTDYQNEMEALNETRKLLEKIQKSFLFTLKQEITDLDWKMKEFSNEATEQLKVFQDHSEINGLFSVSKNYNEDDINKLILNLNSIKHPGPVYDIFISLQKMNDKVGSFIMLYSLLLVYNGPTQSKADRYIKFKRPNIEERKTTRAGADFDETIYTSLRNQLGHLSVSTQTDIDTIHEEIINHYEEFLELIKEMLIEKGLV